MLVGMNHLLAGDYGVIQAHHRLAAGCHDLANERLADGRRHVKEVDPDEIAFFDLRGVTDKLAGEGVDAGVVHKWGR